MQKGGLQPNNGRRVPSRPSDVLTLCRDHPCFPFEVLVVLALALLLIGCGGGAETVVPAASSTNSEVSQLTAAPANIAFGSVSAGTTSSQAITLNNTGTASVTVSQASATGAGFSTKGLSLPLTLVAGQSATFSASFSPTAAGSVTGSLSVVSNASNSPVSVPLSGTGVIQLLSLSPASLNFGNITVGSSSSSTLPVVITNVGSASVTISQASTSGAGFSVTEPALPFTLAAGQNISFNVSFDPTTAGSVTGDLSVVSNTTSSPTVASLSAAGVNKHSVTLTWVASTSPNVMGYNILRGTVSGGPYAQVNSLLVTGTSYQDTTVQAGQTYYYVTTAIDSQGGESLNSNQATAVVPFP